MAHGDELLIVDGTPAHRDGMKRLFEGEGYVCTAVETISDARDHVVRKFFPAALVDVDVERAGAGLDLVRLIRERSPKTAIVVVTVRRTFELAIDAFREGAMDVVLKKPEQVDYLKQRVAVAMGRHRIQQGDAGILTEVSSVLDESFRILLKMARHVYHDVSVGAMANYRPRAVRGQRPGLHPRAGWADPGEGLGGGRRDERRRGPRQGQQRELRPGGGAREPHGPARHHGHSCRADAARRDAGPAVQRPGPRGAHGALRRRAQHRRHPPVRGRRALDRQGGRAGGRAGWHAAGPSRNSSLPR
ncbi:MAG: response regulator [Sandaracinaceae bacterium]|nr:response regulator [Sandaracinaceae bacterium]